MDLKFHFSFYSYFLLLICAYLVTITFVTNGGFNNTELLVVHNLVVLEAVVGC